MFILAHLVAALASVLPILFAIQRGRNGDFDFIYQRTIDYTSSFEFPDILGVLLTTQSQTLVAPVVPLVNTTNVTISQPTQVDMHLEKPAYLNVTGGPSYTAPNNRTAFHRYRQAAFSVVGAWLGLSNYVLLVFDGVFRLMEDLKNLSAELYLHRYDFSHASTPRTQKALVIAYKSLLRSLVRKVLPLSFLLATLVKLFAPILFAVSVGLGCYVYTQFQNLTEGKEYLTREESSFNGLIAHAEGLKKALDQQVLLLVQKEESLRLRETAERELQAQADSLQKDLDQRTKLLAEGQEDLKRHKGTAEQLRARERSLQQDLDQRTKLLAETQQSLKQQETTAKNLQAHADVLQHDLEQQKKLLEDQRHDIEEFQASSKRQLRNSQAKIASLEKEKEARLQADGAAQDKALEQAQVEAQRLQAGNKALDAALMTERQRSCKALNQVRVMETKHTETSRRLNAVNISYENQKQSLKQRTAQIEELSAERDQLAQKARTAEAATQKLRENLEKWEVDFTNEVSAVSSLEQQLLETRGNLDGKAAELEMSYSNQNELSRKLVDIESRSQSLEDEAKRLENELSRKSSTADEYKQQAEDQQNISEEKAAEVVELQSKLDRIHHELAAAQKAQQSLEKRVEEMEHDLKLKASTIETLEAQAPQEKRSSDQNAADLTTAEYRLAALRQDNSTVRARAEKLQERVSCLEHQLDVKVSSVGAYERNSKHQERVLEGRNTELAQALKLVKDLEGQLETLRTEVEDRTNDRDYEVEGPVVRVPRSDDSRVDAEQEAERFAHGANPAHNAPPDVMESQGVATRVDEQEEAPARKRGNRRRKRAGKRVAAKRQPIPRRHSSDSHANKSCLRCGGPLPVQVACIPKELEKSSWEKPAESGVPVRNRRHSLDSLAHGRCRGCGGPLPVEVAFVSETSTTQGGNRAGALSTGSVTTTVAGQIALPREPTPPRSAGAASTDRLDHPVASSTFPNASHTPQQDGISEGDGAQEGAASQSADTPSGNPRRRQRHRVKGRKATDGQEQFGEPDAQEDPTELPTVGQPPAPSILSSRWSAEPGASRSPTLPSPAPSTRSSGGISEGNMSPQPTLLPRPHFSPQQPAIFPPPLPNVFPPYRPPGLNAGFAYNFGQQQQQRQPFSPSNAGFSPPNFSAPAFSPSGFSPNYNAGPAWAPGRRSPLFSGLNNPPLPRNTFPPQGASPGYPFCQPNQPFDPSAREFRPAQTFPSPSPAGFARQGAHRGSAAPRRDSNVSRWAD